MPSQQPLPAKSFDPRTFRDKPVSFVRRSGRMTPSQERAWEDLGPRYLLELPRGHAATSVADHAELDPAAVFGRSAPLVVEVGSGQGHAIVHAASAHRETDRIPGGFGKCRRAPLHDRRRACHFGAVRPA